MARPALPEIIVKYFYFCLFGVTPVSPEASLLNHSLIIHITCNMQMNIFCSINFFDVAFFYILFFIFMFYILGNILGVPLLNPCLIHVTFGMKMHVLFFAIFLLLAYLCLFGTFFLFRVTPVHAVSPVALLQNFFQPSLCYYCNICAQNLVKIGPIVSKFGELYFGSPHH